MAGARAAASLSLTIGVAVATLLVVGGILAGPAILDCAHQGGGLGACLRAKVVDSGLLPAEAMPTETVLSSEAPAPAKPPVLADIPRDAGWIEANATEYEPRPSALAVLSPAPGSLRAGSLAPANSASASAGVALAEQGGELSASVSDAAPIRGASADLTAPTGELSASAGAPVAPVDTSVEVALAAPVGTLAASTPDLILVPSPSADLAARGGQLRAGGIAADPSASPAVDVAFATPTGTLAASPAAARLTQSAAASLVPRPAPVVTGSIGSNALEQGTASLVAKVAPALPPPLPRKLPVRPDIPAAGTEAPATPAPAGWPTQVVAFDPRYPDVIVLPPPNTGDGSSFATLTVER